MWQYNNPEELYHYGVLGMRWGRRKSSADHLSARSIEKKKLREMSNNEIKELTNRLSLERNYRSFKPGTIKQGIAAVTTTAGILGSIIAIKNNGPQVIKIGKDLVDKFKNLKIPKMK